MQDRDVLTLAVQNAKLVTQLAEIQEQAIELAVDAGELHDEIAVLQARLVQAERDRDAWKAEVEQVRRIS